MIVDLPDTTTSEVSARLVRIREEVGAMALTRVLALVIVVDESGVEGAIDTANEASHVHPCRIIVVALGNPGAAPASTASSASAATPARARSSSCGSTAS